MMANDDRGYYEEAQMEQVAYNKGYADALADRRAVYDVLREYNYEALREYAELLGRALAAAPWEIDVTPMPPVVSTLLQLAESYGLCVPLRRDDDHDQTCAICSRKESSDAQR